MMVMISARELSKDYRIYQREKGFKNSLKSLLKREYTLKQAVKNINFDINKGELVGYIGPNGAGKSTTIKMLSGILVPSSGSITVNGITPYLNRKENARNIGVVFGQRSQLYWDLPMEETFDLYKKMYRIDDEVFKKNVRYYIELLEMEEFLRRPVRQLSLGQKMKANIAIAMLHNPAIIYLDEPTIGLDVVAKKRIRQFIKEINRERETTVILTTHDMDDIEEICNRIIMIDNGQILYDGTLANFKHHYGKKHMVIVEFLDEDIVLEEKRLVVSDDGKYRKSFIFSEDEISVAEAINYLTRNFTITDLKIKEPNVEETVRRIYESQKLMI